MDTPEQQLVLPPLTQDLLKQYYAWWEGLSDQWKKAYNEVIRRLTTTERPEDQILHQIHHSPAQRFAGPTAPYPNMTFELDDLSGVTGLSKVEILVVTFHQIESLKEISHMTQLKSLFVYNNKITSLEGVENLTNLTELYFNVNQVGSLKPLEHLTGLSTLYCNYNKLRNLDGIGLQHEALKNFYCLPNDDMPESVAIRFEHQYGIRAKKG